MNFTKKRAGETEIFSVDFVNNLAAGEAIETAEWSITVKTGTDPAASSMIQGTATIEENGTIVSQVLTGGVAGVTYSPICTITTSLSQTIILPDPGKGSLEVVA